MNSIWHKNPEIEKVNLWNKNTLLETLDIKIVEISDRSVTGIMPVSTKVLQPYGLLHGGASVVLAESLGSIGANLTLNTDEKFAVGQMIDANHIRPVKQGIVTGVAEPIHLGASSQVWKIEIFDDRKKLICFSKITMAILKRR